MSNIITMYREIELDRDDVLGLQRGQFIKEKVTEFYPFGVIIKVKKNPYLLRGNPYIWGVWDNTLDGAIATFKSGAYLEQRFLFKPGKIFLLTDEPADINEIYAKGF